MDDRIEVLETKFSYMERTMSELNEIVARQQRAIDEQSKKITALVTKLRTLKEEMAEGKLIEKLPPHY
jgi:uncharacterized coiled-coil protein SlyX